MGLARTRERLLEKANGKYIFWLDADDYWECTLLEKAVKVFEKTDADVVGWGYVRLSHTGDLRQNSFVDLGVDEWRRINIWGLWPMVWQYAAKKEVWTDLEGIPNDIDLTDDVWFTSQIALKAKKIEAIGEYLYFYDCNNINSMSHGYTGTALCTQALTAYGVVKRNQEKNIPDLTLGIRRAIRRLVEAYCVNCVRPSMTDYQINLVKSALRDLFENYPTKGARKYYLIHLFVIHGIDFICYWYGRNKIRRFELYHQG